MAKKTATYANYELRAEDNGKIVILNAGQLMPNAKGAIRTIAAEVNFTLDPKWNTQSAGRKLIDFLNSATNTSSSAQNEDSVTPASATSVNAEESKAPASVSKHDPKPTTERENKPEILSDNHKTDNELTEEEMKQIDELIKRIDAIEARMVQLEKGLASTTPSSDKNLTRLVVEKEYLFSIYSRKYDSNGLIEYRKEGFVDAFKPLVGNNNPNLIKDLAEEILELKKMIISINNIKARFGFCYNSRLGRYHSSFYNGIRFNTFSTAAIDISYGYTLLSDGKVYIARYHGNDLNAVKSVAAIVGFDVPKGTRKDKLAAELVSKYGDGKVAVIGANILYPSGSVYGLTETNSYSKMFTEFQDKGDEIRKYFKESTPLNIEDSMSIKEKFESLSNYINGLSLIARPQDNTAQADEFEKVAKRILGEMDINI